MPDTQTDSPKPATHWLNSSGIVGSLVLLIMSVLQLVRAIQAEGLGGVNEALLMGIVGSAAGVAIFVWRLAKKSSPPIVLSRSATGDHVRLIAVLALMPALLLCRCSGFTHALVDKILHTTSVGTSLIDTWCDPATFPSMDVEACESAKTWAKVGEAGLALILPHFVEPEFGDEDPPPPKSQMVVMSCLRVKESCDAAKHSEHLKLCETARAGCAGDGALISFDPDK